MVVHLTKEEAIQALVPGPSMQELLDEERVPVPEAFRAKSYEYLGSEDIPTERYTSREFHDLEVERMWARVWQVACREEEIPNPGDIAVYDLARYSILVVRQMSGEIKAFHNACLHRGTQLRDCDGHASSLPCSFHGFCWNLDGSLKYVPSAWDFPHVEPEKFHLPEVRVGTWEGFVFVNLDDNAPPLEDYLGDIVQHFESMARPPLRDRFKAVHVAKPVRCNWKVALEAFLESYHTVTTHAQSLPYAGDANTEYDIYPDQPHWDRMIMPFGVPSPHLGNDVGAAEVLAALKRDQLFFGSAEDDNGDGDGRTPRQLMAAQMRTAIGAMTGFDASELTDSEAIDAIQYFVFPNLCPWPGFGVPLVYRFRPYGNDPDMSIMEVMMLLPLPEGTPRPPAAPVHWLGVDDDWTAAGELGNLAMIFNQDASNLPKIQRGLHATAKSGVTLGDYQEIRIRHFHQVLERYVTSADPV